MKIEQCIRLLLCTTLALGSGHAMAEDPPALVGASLTTQQLAAQSRRYQLAIVIDDLGYSRARDQRALDLPGNLTYAVLPGSPYAAEIAAAATGAGKEIILHQPMQTIGQPHRHEQGALHTDLSEEEFRKTLNQNLLAVPGIVGINNHRGSLLTSSAPAMQQLMSQLAHRGLYFLDSRTTAATVAHDTAKDWGIPTLKRDVFLDHVRTPEAVAKEFRRALGIARKQGFAIMIAHPHTVSLDHLSQALRGLPADFETVTLSGLLPSDG